MKKSVFIAVVGFLLILPLGFIVLETKLFELRIILERRKILNFSFSSEILRSKFEGIISNKENIKAEMKLNHLQSSLIGNTTSELSLEPTFVHETGAVLINSVRSLSLKTGINLHLNSSKIRLLEHAFALERNQFYKEAYRTYEESFDQFGKQSEEGGFIQLHQGFCLAVQGEFDSALRPLYEVIANHPSTLLSSDAEILISLILKAKQSVKEIENNLDDPEKRARAFFAKGNYAKALEEIEKAKINNPEMNYIKGYSLEKTGHQPEAIKEYAALAFSDKNKDIAIKANRRLLMLGYYYNAGSEIASLSDKNAERLGDTSEAKEIKTSSEKLKQPKALFDNGNSDLKNEALNQELSKQNQALLEDVIQKSNQFLKKAEAPPPPKPMIKITVADADPVYAFRIVIEGDKAKLFSSHFPITLPTFSIESISMDKNATKTTQLIMTKDSIKQSFIKASVDDDSITLTDKVSKKKIQINSAIKIEVTQ
ncbi:hypothetical protein CH370_11125 [Leptospira kmetyi]|uniref:tetratricopeptide repeat protein n=1 Tax=Leptospira kmetyi TaxID=408139 RepID=UPI000289A8BF|nr:hypothetical protein [Leptospira kmetyi]EQA52507.1 hypothetical protein LEP1GSC052_3052 [Leptospira kmetyi serovar Malaysia str. Bejo-Iso9]PJZ41345.1 hypothetical protein CH370_11125 [Leptospira kmetyi]TGL66814.1 hypothetical protein EHQ67_15870 [Leptospira kmetyi]